MRYPLAPLPAERSTELNHNPDRGFRLELKVNVGVLATLADESAMRDESAHIIESERDGGEAVTLAQTYFYLHAYLHEDLPETALTAMRIFLEVLHEHGMKAVLRFAYEQDMLDEKTSATQGRMFRHILQLNGIMTACEPYIHVIQIGFLGAWGEWHSYFHAVDRAHLMEVIVHYLAPPTLYLQARQPSYKALFPCDDPAYKRIGYHNDAFFGKSGPHGGDGGIYDGSEPWQQLRADAAYTPQDGELYWSFWNRDTGIYADGYACLQAFSEHRFTSFSVLHGYADTDCAPDCTMERWKRQEITPELLERWDILYDTAWFTDANGRPIRRSVFDYVRDHFGYRIELQELELQKTETGYHARLRLVNYGFSAAFNMESGFAVLDEQGNAVAEYPAGEPCTWYNRPPEYTVAASLLHTVAADIGCPDTDGQYRLAFFLRNRIGDTARPANDLPFQNGYTVLCELGG